MSSTIDGVEELEGSSVCMTMLFWAYSSTECKNVEGNRGKQRGIARLLEKARLHFYYN